MKLKNIFIYMVSLLLVLLVACNNNDNNALDNKDKKPNEVAQNMKNDLKDDNDSISSDFTNMSSEKYPHTRPFIVQQAKYKYYVIGPGQDERFQVPVQPEVDINRLLPGSINRGTLPQPAPAKKQQQAPAPQQPKVEKQAPPNPEPAPTPAPKQQAQAGQADQGISDAERKVIQLTNAERTKRGLPELQADTKLSNVAGVKSSDMMSKHYFSHTSPTYGSPFDMMRDFGVTYTSAGENIAHGQQTPEQVVNAWMNSEGHRKNILSPNFTHIGVGFEGTGNYWTQMFIGK